MQIKITFILSFVINILSFSQVSNPFHYDKNIYKDSALIYLKKNNIIDINKEDILSIPVLDLQGKKYKCGDMIEKLISLKKAPNFQMLIIKNKNEFQFFQMFDSYYKLMNNISSIYDPPIIFDSENIEKKLMDYQCKNPNNFIFIIQHFHGYWVMKEGKIFKIINSKWGIKEIDGDIFWCENYGEELTNDITLNGGIKVGKKYLTCPNCKIRKKR